MEIAIEIESNIRVLTKQGINAICECCGVKVSPKCGPIKIHHWAHPKGSQCSDKWWEAETEWHRDWKSRFPVEWREIVKTDEISGEKHRADIYRPDKDLYIEFQNSQISLEELQSRESFYNNLIWVINVNQKSIKLLQIHHLVDIHNDEYIRAINQPINKLIYLNEMEIKSLFDYRDDLLKKKRKGSLIPELKSLMHKFDSLVNEALSNNRFLNNGIPKKTILDIRNELVKSLVYQSDKELNEFMNINTDRETIYFSINWINTNHVWSYASKHIFIEFQENLYYLLTGSIVKKISKQTFLDKYSVSN
jgi:competence CoiA-like predicted nuclease